MNSLGMVLTQRCQVYCAITRSSYPCLHYVLLVEHNCELPISTLHIISAKLPTSEHGEVIQRLCAILLDRHCQAKHHPAGGAL